MIIGKTDSGMLYGVKRSGAKVAYCALSIKCGTRDEEGYPNGIAHFTEHTIFKGTTHKKASAISSYIDSLGGELNAYTTKEEIVLHSTVLKEDISKACSLLMELATCPSFPEKEIETERGVVIDEILSYRDSPADDVYDHFETMLFEGHPLSPMILGNIQSVKKITAEELRRFVAEKFIPESMAFTMVADIDERKMESTLKKMAAKYFPTQSDGTGGMAGRKPEGEKYFCPPKNIFDKKVEKRHHEANVVIGCLAPSLYDEKERLTAILLGNILAGPASNSILCSILREKNGWVYAVESSYTQYSDTGIMAITLGCDRDNLEKCLLSVKKEILKLQTIPLSDRRLKAAKKQLLGQLAISGDNGESQCLSMGKSLLAYGTIPSDESNRNRIESITSEDLMNSAREIFGKDRVSQLIYL